MGRGDVLRGSQAIPLALSLVTPADSSLYINGSLSIPRDELDVRVSRSSGAGGQHVNKTSSRVEIFWNVLSSRVLGDEQRSRLREKLESRLTTEGSIRVVASDSRSQTRNRELAEERLADLIARSLIVPRKRKATKPTKAAREARLDAKKKHSSKKRQRSQRSFD